MIRRFVHCITRMLTWGTRSRKNADTEYYLGYVAAFVLFGVWFTTAGYYWGTVMSIAGAMITIAVIRRRRRRRD
jgi:hypothetical protein